MYIYRKNNRFYIEQMEHIIEQFAIQCYFGLLVDTASKHYALRNTNIEYSIIKVLFDTVFCTIVVLIEVETPYTCSDKTITSDNL